MQTIHRRRYCNYTHNNLSHHGDRQWTLIHATALIGAILSVHPTILEKACLVKIIRFRGAKSTRDDDKAKGWTLKAQATAPASGYNTEAKIPVPEGASQFTFAIYPDNAIDGATARIEGETTDGTRTVLSYCRTVTGNLSFAQGAYKYIVIISPRNGLAITLTLTYVA